MQKNTTFMKFPYADELEPDWDAYEAQMQSQDEAAFMAKLQNNLFVAGGGTILLNATSNLLTWTADFVIPVFHFGRSLLVSFGPDEATRACSLPNGAALVIEIPFTMTANVVTTVTGLSQLTPLNHQQWVLGWRYGNKVYFKGLGVV